MRSLRTQFPRVPAPIPRSRAISTTGLRVSRTIRTAPALNSGSYLRRVCDIAPPHRRCLHDSGGYPARTRPNSALLKKMDPAPAALVARHSATTARQPPRRPIDTHHRAPAPAAAKTLTPRAPTPRPAPQNSPNNAHNPNTRPQHNPTSEPATRNHTKKHKPEPLTNSRERSGLGTREATRCSPRI